MSRPLVELTSLFAKKECFKLINKPHNNTIPKQLESNGVTSAVVRGELPAGTDDS